jgi:hypothetical protein
VVLPEIFARTRASDLCNALIDALLSVLVMIGRFTQWVVVPYAHLLYSIGLSIREGFLLRRADANLSVLTCTST